MIHDCIERRWQSLDCIVAGSGPSLEGRAVARLRDKYQAKVIAVNDAYRRVPDADVLFASDSEWWDVHEGVPSFHGERWSTYSLEPGHADDKRGNRYRLNLVRATDGETFSFDPTRITYGNCSGFAAINLAIAFGATSIHLLGFDMKAVEGKTHFFGSHPAPLRDIPDYSRFFSTFQSASDALNERVCKTRFSENPCVVQISNCTKDSALKCFELEWSEILAEL